MRRLGSLVAVCLLSGSLAGGALLLRGPRGAGAAGFGAGEAVIVATDRLNLRAGPGLTAAVALVLEQGDTLAVLDGPTAADGHDWYEVETAGGDDGWAAGEFLDAAARGAGAAFSPGDAVEVATNVLAERRGPSLDAEVVGNLPAGFPGTVVAGPTAADGYAWYQIALDGSTAGDPAYWSAGEFLAAPAEGAFTAGDGVRVVDGRLNLRDGPGLASGVRLVLDDGALLDVEGDPVAADGHAWYPVFGGLGVGYGWVAGEYLAADPHEALNTGRT